MTDQVRTEEMAKDEVKLELDNSAKQASPIEPENLLTLWSSR